VESESPSRGITVVARLLAMIAAGLLSVGLVVGFAFYSSSSQADAAGRSPG
jgi:methyl-accepting chemotaxis protein